MTWQSCDIIHRGICIKYVENFICRWSVGICISVANRYTGSCYTVTKLAISFMFIKEIWSSCPSTTPTIHHGSATRKIIGMRQKLINVNTDYTWRWTIGILIFFLKPPNFLQRKKMAPATGAYVRVFNMKSFRDSDHFMKSCIESMDILK